MVCSLFPGLNFFQPSFPGITVVTHDCPAAHVASERRWNMLKCIRMYVNVCYNVLRMVQANGNVFVLQV